MDISKNLIKQCTCGNSTSFTSNTICDISILQCTECNVSHQALAGWDENRLNDFYSNHYHTEYMQTTGHVSYYDRYEHDLKIAALRYASYQLYLPKGKTSIDIGSSNGAFVDYAASQGYDAWGLEPGSTVKFDKTICGTLASAKLIPGVWHLITMHDSIEHMIDINVALERVHSLLTETGLVIIDLPNFWHTAGLHHWKVVEHLWFHDKEQMIALLNKHNFVVDHVDEPIPGKLVFFAFKK